jgi:hypothetical protein
MSVELLPFATFPLYPPRADVGADIAGPPVSANSGHCRRSPNGRYGMSADPGSLGLNVGCLDHLSPLIGIVDQEFPEVRWRQRHRDVSEAGDTFPKLGI